MSEGAFDSRWQEDCWTFESINFWPGFF